MNQFYYNINIFTARSGKRIAIAFLILAILVTSIRIILPCLEHFLIENKPLQHADALVVMAGNATERIPAAARLYREGKADRILLTNDGVLGGWSEEKQRNLYQVEWAEDKLLKMGIPETAVIKLAFSSSGTIYDALNTRAAVMIMGIKSIVIVTSDYHTKRSLWTLNRVFTKQPPIKIGVFPVKPNVTETKFLKRFMILTYEFLKFLYYTYKY